MSNLHSYDGLFLDKCNPVSIIKLPGMADMALSALKTRNARKAAIPGIFCASLPADAIAAITMSKYL